MSPEIEQQAAADWVRAALRGVAPGIDEALAARFDALPARVVAEVARSNGVVAWVVAALDAAGRAEAVTASGLRGMATAGAFYGLQLDQELVGLLDELGALGLAGIVLKGPAVAHRYYPSPELRPYGDIDLLVRERDEATVHGLLQRRGYAQASGETREPLHHEHAKFQATFKRPDGCVVDLHRDHLQIGLRPLSLDEVWKRAVPSPWGAAVRVLEDHDQFVLLAVHLQRHGFRRLLWFKDLDLMVRRGTLDWNVIAEIARLEGCTSAVAYALVLLEEVLGTPLPEGARRLTRQRGLFTRTVQTLLWPRDQIVALTPQKRRFQWRRATQFAPEAGLVRGGLPSLLTWGRRGAKARVLLAAVTGRRSRPS